MVLQYWYYSIRIWYINAAVPVGEGGQVELEEPGDELQRGLHITEAKHAEKSWLRDWRPLGLERRVQRPPHSRQCAAQAD